MDIKSQKGDSNFAAAANELTQTITNNDSREMREKTIANQIRDHEFQSTLVNTDTLNTKGCFARSSTPTGKRVKTKKKTRQQKITDQNWGCANAFQQQWQQQQKQFTYSVSYFNWAVSDEEDEEDEIPLQFSSSSNPVISSSCTAKSYHSICRNPVQNVETNRQKTTNKYAIPNGEVKIENEVPELSVTSSSDMGVVLTEEYIDVTLPLRRLNISRQGNSIR